MNSRNYNDRPVKGKNIPGDEPIDQAIDILVSWGAAWPRIIAKVWKEQYDKKTSGTKHSEWYDQLFSDNPDDVKHALLDVGFMGDDDLHDDESWFWNNISIKVRNYSGDTEYTPDLPEEASTGKGQNGYKDFTDLRHEITLVVPPRPEKPELFGEALSDYNNTGRVYPFTCFTFC